MIVVTTPDIPGMRVVETLGLVRGNTIRTRHVGKDILAALRNLAGGEVRKYTKMMAEPREQAIDRMVEGAETLGADAVVMVRFQTGRDDARRGGDALLRHRRLPRAHPLRSGQVAC